MTCTTVVCFCLRITPVARHKLAVRHSLTAWIRFEYGGVQTIKVVLDLYAMPVINVARSHGSGLLELYCFCYYAYQMAPIQEPDTTELELAVTQVV